MARPPGASPEYYSSMLAGGCSIAGSTTRTEPLEKHSVPSFRGLPPPLRRREFLCAYDVEVTPLALLFNDRRDTSGTHPTSRRGPRTSHRQPRAGYAQSPGRPPPQRSWVPSRALCRGQSPTAGPNGAKYPGCTSSIPEPYGADSY